jgi:hypothetical protein
VRENGVEFMVNGVECHADGEDVENIPGDVGIVVVSRCILCRRDAPPSAKVNQYLFLFSHIKIRSN